MDSSIWDTAHCLKTPQKFNMEIRWPFLKVGANQPNFRWVFYADNIKINYPVSSPGDCCVLQNILTRFSNWCNNDRLILTLSKCNVISWTGTSSPIIYSYTIDDIPINHVEVVKDLFVWLYVGLKITNHIEYWISGAGKRLEDWNVWHLISLTLYARYAWSVPPNLTISMPPTAE